MSERLDEDDLRHVRAMLDTSTASLRLALRRGRGQDAARYATEVRCAVGYLRADLGAQGELGAPLVTAMRRADRHRIDAAEDELARYRAGKVVTITPLGELVASLVALANHYEGHPIGVQLDEIVQRFDRRTKEEAR